MTFEQMLVIGGQSTFKIALRWMTLDLTDVNSTFVQVMTWYHQATSDYKNQYWLGSMSSCGVTGPGECQTMHAKLRGLVHQKTSIKLVFSFGHGYIISSKQNKLIYILIHVDT